jgi:hypothetical protein
MKTLKIKRVLAVVVCIVFLQTGKILSQPPINCPYTIFNNHPCSVLFAWEVREPICTGVCAGGPPCPTFGCCPTSCSGTVCLASGGSFQTSCCPSNADDVVVTVISIDSSGNCNNPNCNPIGGTSPCANGTSCTNIGGNPITGSLPAGCCNAQSTFTVTWSWSSVTIQ